MSAKYRDAMREAAARYKEKAKQETPCEMEDENRQRERDEWLALDDRSDADV